MSGFTHDPDNTCRFCAHVLQETDHWREHVCSVCWEPSEDEELKACLDCSTPLAVEGPPLCERCDEKISTWHAWYGDLLGLGEPQKGIDREEDV